MNPDALVRGCFVKTAMYANRNYCKFIRPFAPILCG